MTKLSEAVKVGPGAESNGAEGTSLFPLPQTPLGKACSKFVDVTQEIAQAKVKREEAKKAILIEMHKEGRERLTVTIDNENWSFEIKPGVEDLRCVKVTRQPAVKLEETEE